MGERYLVIDRLKLSYEGLFNSNEVYNIIASFFYEKGWDWYEKFNEEQVTPQGKQIKMVFAPWKSASDYYKISIHIRLHMTDVRDVEVEVDGKPVKVNHGVVRMMFDGYVISDRKGKWDSTPLLWFISILMDKYFFKQHYAKFETWVKSDVDDLHNKLKSYFNMFKYNYHQ